MNEAFIACRTLGHAWDDISGLTRQGRVLDMGIRKAFRCTRCGTERLEVWSRTNFKLVQREYRYPEGYDKIDLSSDSMTQRQVARQMYVEMSTKARRRHA